VLPIKGHLDEVDIVFFSLLFRGQENLKIQPEKGVIKVYWKRGKSNSNRAVVTRPCRSRPLGNVRSAVVPGVTVQNIQSSEIGMKSGILDRKDVGVFTGFIMVGVPVTCGGDERGTGFPVFPVTVLDHAV
jgi:hypothetical protein